MSMTVTDKFKNQNHRWEFYWKKNDEFGTKVICRVAGLSGNKNAPFFMGQEIRDRGQTKELNCS